MSKYSDEQWNAINNANCVEVATLLGLTFDEKRSDKSALRVNDSGGLFVFRNGRSWFCHSTEEKGGPVELVERERNCTYREALDFIWTEVLHCSSLPTASHTAVYSRPTEKSVEEEKEFTMPELEHSAKRAYGYLINARKIDYEIVKSCVTSGIVAQEKKHSNCCFIGRDVENKARYCAMRGTVTIGDAAKYRGEASGSNKLYGFTMKGKSRKLYVFEAAIDAMSHASLAKICGRDWQQDTRLALGGCYTPALEQHLKDYPDAYDSIIVCTDNDEAGHKMLKRIQDIFSDRYTVTRKVPITKDWNEDLQAIHSMAAIGTEEHEPIKLNEQLSYSMHNFYCSMKSNEVEKEITQAAEETTEDMER